MASLKELMRAYEKSIVTQTLRANKGDKALTARALDISPRFLNKILERHGLIRPRFVRPLPIPVARTDDDREA